MENNENNIYSVARYLGELLKEDERIEALNKARDEYTNDPEIVMLMAEYQAQQNALALAYGNDEEVVKKINDRISEIYDIILATEVYKKYEAAQNVVNELMEQVNRIISTVISGDTGSCTHDCSTCGGCH